MNQSLKDFMAENRHDFDDELPGIHNWSAVEKRLSLTKTKKPRFRYGWAAAIIFLLASSVALYMVFNHKDDTQSATAESSSTEDFEQWPAEFAAKAKSYYETIEERQRQLLKLSKKEPALVNQFNSDLSALDSAYQILHRQASQTPGSEVIIKAMIQNLQLQAELLSKQLQIINQYSNQQKYSHEKENSRSL